MGGYKSLSSFATVVTVLLALNALSAFGTIGSSVMQLDLLERIEIGDFTDAELEANDAREQLLGLGTLGLYLITAVGFIAWFRRAYENLAAFGHETAHTTGWAIGAWFVPFLNLFRPFQIAREIWNRSDPAARPREAADPEDPLERALREDDPTVEGGTPPLLGAWWGAWIVGNVVGQVAFRLTLNANTPGEFVASTMANIAADVVTLVSAPLAILVVRAITARQEAVGARLTGSSEPLQF